MVEYAEYEDGSRWMPDSGNFIPWTSKNGLNDRAPTFMPEFGKDVSYSSPDGTSFGRNTEAFSNSVMSQALDKAQKDEAQKDEAAKQSTTEFERISNPETYDPTDAPESFHLGEIVGADTIDEKWDPEKWKGRSKLKQLNEEIETFLEEHDPDNLSKEEAYELGKMYEAAGTNYNEAGSNKSRSAIGNIVDKVMGKALGVDTADYDSKMDAYNKFSADYDSEMAKKYLDYAYAKDKADTADEEAAKEKAKEKLGSSAPASSRFTADMKGESKVDTTPSKTFEDVKKEADESKKELNKDPLPNVGPRDYTDYNTDEPEFKNGYTDMTNIKRAAEQTGVDPETVKAIAGAPKFIQTIESKLGDLLLKMGRRAARYNPLTLAVALYESVKNGEGMEKSIDKAIDALGLERDSMTQDEYDALYKEIEGIRSSIDKGDFKISISGRGTAAASADATPTDFFDGLLNTDKTDYSGYNAGLKAETASDKNTKEIIVRVYKKDPVLRLLKC